MRWSWIWPKHASLVSTILALLVCAEPIASREQEDPPAPPAEASWDAQITTDYMPNRFITFRLEYNHRFANVPYFSGRGGVTPPGGNEDPPGSTVPGFTPDLRKNENRMTFALLVKM